MNIGWTAINEDGTVIKQYPSNGAENLFSLVEKKMPKYFYVGKKYGVNLETGAFFINSKWYQVGNRDGIWRKPLNLIYFRRNQVDYTPGERHYRILILTISLPPAKPRKVKCDSYFGYEYANGRVTVCIPKNGKNPTICIG